MTTTNTATEQQINSIRTLKATRALTAEHEWSLTLGRRAWREGKLSLVLADALILHLETAETPEFSAEDVGKAGARVAAVAAAGPRRDDEDDDAVLGLEDADEEDDDEEDEEDEFTLDFEDVVESVESFDRPTEKQTRYIDTLIQLRDLTVPGAQDTVDDMWEALSAGEFSREAASNVIDLLVDLPSRHGPSGEPAEVPEGMHRHEGKIYKVQVAHHRSGRPYAKRLVVDEDEDGRAVFEYAPGVVRGLSAETLMSLQEAKYYGALYGVCVVCGRTLTDEGSIAAGIGPVCAGRF